MNNTVLITTTIVFLLLFTVTTSCDNSEATLSATKQTPTEESMSNSSSPLNDSYWILSEINGESADDSCSFELHFGEKAGNYLESHQCCNNCGAKSATPGFQLSKIRLAEIILIVVHLIFPIQSYNKKTIILNRS